MYDLYVELATSIGKVIETSNKMRDQLYNNECYDINRHHLMIRKEITTKKKTV